MLDKQTAEEKLRELFATDDVAWVQRALTTQSHSETIRIVGGTTRDMLLKRKDVLAPNQDLDFATPIIPKKVEKLLNTANIKTIRKGKSFEHGTVIALLPRGNISRQFEITSLRKDIDTDGRHAKVTFTKSWKKDSNRRDFTINALYGDSKGKIHDFHNGIDDLKQKKLRFIGDPQERINEDALRILRFFRFSALMDKTRWSEPQWIKEGEDDNTWIERAEKHWEPVKGNAHLLDKLSGERVWAELEKILSISNNKARYEILKAMKITGVLQGINPSLTEIEVEWLVGKQKVEPPFDSLVRLAALLKKGSKALQGVAERLSLSREELKRLEVLSKPLHPSDTDDIEWLRALHKQGKEIAKARLCLTAAREGTSPNAEFLKYEWQKISFPITGNDVMQELEIKPGPEIRKILVKVENWWLLDGRKEGEEGKKACLEYLRKEFGEK